MNNKITKNKLLRIHLIRVPKVKGISEVIIDFDVLDNKTKQAIKDIVSELKLDIEVRWPEDE